jgi:hypothetical protein
MNKRTIRMPYQFNGETKTERVFIPVEAVWIEHTVEERRVFPITVALPLHLNPHDVVLTFSFKTD